MAKPITSYKVDNEEAFNTFYEQNEKLIYFVYHKYASQPMFKTIKEELFEACQISFLRAYQLYDESKDCTFATYAVPGMHLSCVSVINRFKLEKEKEKRNVSLDKDRYKDGAKETTMKNVISSTEDIERSFIDTEIKKTVWDLFSSKNSRDKEIMILHLVEKVKQNEIAERYGIEQPCVSNIIRTQIRNAKKRLEGYGIYNLQDLQYMINNGKEQWKKELFRRQRQEALQYWANKKEESV